MNASPHTARWPAVATATVAILGIVAAAPSTASASDPPGRGHTSSATAAGVKTVTNTHDKGPGSLRAAMIAINNNPTKWDTIHFDIKGLGPLPRVIAPKTDLPFMTAPVTIDGYTQKFAAEATKHRLARLMIVIEANGLGQGIQVDGGDSVVTGLVVRDAQGDGIRAVGDGNTIVGNYVGLDVRGQNPAGNAGNGIFVAGDGNTVGGTSPADRNVVSDNTDSGILVRGTQNHILGNTVGTNAAGSLDLGNAGYGVAVEGSFNTVSGGTDPGTYNLVSGNDLAGVLVEGDEGNLVAQSLIGTNAKATLGLGNGDAGVLVEAPGTNVSLNVIGSNGGSGVAVRADDSQLFQNQVGVSTTSAGVSLLPNRGDGIAVDAEHATIGGSDAGNTVAANVGDGIRVLSGFDQLIQGNFVGTDATSSTGLGNRTGGIVLEGGQSTVGGDGPGDGNVVSGNRLVGVNVLDDGNLISGNFIGTDLTDTLEIPNVGNGIDVNASLNQISNNTVKHNRAVGIEIDGGTNNPITGNRVSDNRSLGIDLAPLGVNGNDGDDADGGPNDGMNFPIPTLARIVGPNTMVTWSIEDGLADTRMQLEFFASDRCDGNPAGDVGEGAVPLGTWRTKTGDTGDAGGVAPVDLARPGQAVTVTATLVGAGGRLGPTSEFSVCTRVMG